MLTKQPENLESVGHKHSAFAGQKKKEEKNQQRLMCIIKQLLPIIQNEQSAQKGRSS